MTLGNKIAQYRKNQGITQDALAQQLGVTNQAVSKWESEQCCPDVMLLPKLADIFSITLDELFDREPQSAPEPECEKKESIFEKMFGISLKELDEKASQKARTEQNDDLPWPDDNVLRVAVYVGNQMVCGGKAEKGYEYSYKGDVDGVLSCVTVSCGDVQGDVSAGGNVSCGEVEGDVSAGGNVNCSGVDGDVSAGGSIDCDNVEGDIDAGGAVNCGNVSGDVDAGASVNCGNVDGDVDAGTYVNCGNVVGDVDAGTDVKCGDVGGDVDAGCTVECGSVEGDIDANGPVIIRK